MIKNKILTLLLLFISILAITGCDSNNINVSTSANNSFVDLGDLGNNIRKTDIKCDAISDIVDYSFYSNTFITNNGELYQLSFDKLFSNNTNCKKIENDKSFVKFIKGGILDSENNIYYFDSDTNSIKQYNFENGYIQMPYIKSISSDDYKNVFYVMLDNENNYYFYYNNIDNNVYGYNKDLTLKQEPVLSLNNETVEYILDGGIKTDTNYYIYSKSITNKDECEKYVDVKCIENVGFNKLDNTKISSQYKYIKFIKYYSNNYIILDINNNVYTYLMAF